MCVPPEIRQVWGRPPGPLAPWKLFCQSSGNLTGWQRLLDGQCGFLHPWPRYTQLQSQASLPSSPTWDPSRISHCGSHRFLPRLPPPSSPPTLKREVSSLLCSVTLPSDHQRRRTPGGCMSFSPSPPWGSCCSSFLLPSVSSTARRGDVKTHRFPNPFSP